MKLGDLRQKELMKEHLSIRLNQKMVTVFMPVQELTKHPSINLDLYITSHRHLQNMFHKKLSQIKCIVDRTNILVWSMKIVCSAFKDLYQNFIFIIKILFLGKYNS